MLKLRLIGDFVTARANVAGVARNISLRTLALLHFLVLKVDRNGDMRYAAVGNRSATCQVDDILNMRGSHDALVVDGRHP